MTEKRVIGGLQQLTELLFKQHFKQNAVTQNDEPLQYDEVSTSTVFEATSSGMETDDKENVDGPFQQFLDNAMDDGHGETFCAMVINQLTDGHPVDHREEWHHGQLEAYNQAHKRLFEQVE